MELITGLMDNDEITINLFGKEESVMVFSTGDNRYDEEGDYKEDGFPLNNEELECLNWFIANIDICDYKKEITEYCNECYDMIGDKQITEADLEDEISIYAIAINIGGVVQSYDGFVYPEISFYGDCECDPEHGICIGFRDKKFLGIHSQDWTL
ncbi:MAG: hypothetical protein K2K35_06410 [Lachnospiraceae bacterium]|nr:hypothetical protein [Lachnospiraceae bacterium]